MSDDCASSMARVVENIPIVGHLVAMCHACAKRPAHAERAGIKATIGVLMCICNCPTEAVDEGVRKISPKLYSYALTSRLEWMKKYHHLTLLQICIPGSHQSTSYSVHDKLSSLPTATGWAKCQDLSLAAQLKGGVRFFDLRVMSDRQGDIWTHHNVMTCVSLKEVLETVRSFVGEHPSEIVGLFITNDGKPIDWTVCTSLLNEYIGDKLIHEYMRDMMIGDIVDQGKQIFISGIPNVAFSWKNLQAHWPNKQWPDDLHDDFENMLAEFYDSGPQSYFWYKAECTPGTHMVIRSLGGVPGAAAHKCADEKFEFVEDMAAAANYVVYEILNQADKLPINVLSTDFVNDEIVDRIIELNGQTSEHDDTLVMGTSNDNILDAMASQSKMSISFAAHDQSSSYSEQKIPTKVVQPASLMPDPQVDFIPPPRRLATDKRGQRVSYNKDTSFASSRLSNASSRSPARYSGQRTAHNVSIRSSLNTTSNSTIVGSFEIPSRKAPPVEVRETTM